jgi:hypothetical protein
MSIKSRPTQRGNEKESKWPSDYGEGGRGRYVRIDGKYVNVTEEWKETRRTAAIHQDTMDAIEHPAEPGKLIDSKSKFRAITRKHGLEEVGNEEIKQREPARKGCSEEDYVNDVKKAINDLRWGNAPLTEYERARCREIDRRRNNHG